MGLVINKHLTTVMVVSNNSKCYESTCPAWSFFGRIPTPYHHLLCIVRDPEMEFQPEKEVGGLILHCLVSSLTHPNTLLAPEDQNPRKML